MKRPLIWVAARPLAVLLPLEALLLFWHLDLLSPWFDEADTLLFMHGPLRQAIAIPASGLHPPLYFLLLWCWMHLPLGLAWTVQARTLSVLFTLASTFAVDRLWTRGLAAGARWWFLTLWALSPFLLLYGRMSRSYSMQLLLGVAAAAYILRFAEKRSRGNFAMVWALLAVAIYTHYVPGVALIAAANVVLARRGRWRDAAALDGLTALALLPWMAWLIPQLKEWGAHHVGYALTGGMATELVLKLAYWAMSFTMGEAIPDAALLLGALLVPLVLILVFFGLRRQGELAWLAIPAAAVGFLGVTRWVAYPFIPARMIFCFPLFLTFFIAGAAAHRRAGRLAQVGDACGCRSVESGAISTWRDFATNSIRCQWRRSARAFARVPQPAMRRCWWIPAIPISSGSTMRWAMRQRFSPPKIRAHRRRSPNGLEIRVSARSGSCAIRTTFHRRRSTRASRRNSARGCASPLTRTSRLRRWNFDLMRALGMHNPPRYFHELLEFQR